MDEIRTGLTAEQSGLISRITGRGARNSGADFVTEAGEQISVKFANTSFIGTDSGRKLIRNLNRNPSVILLLDAGLPTDVPTRFIPSFGPKAARDLQQFLIDGGIAADRINILDDFTKIPTVNVDDLGTVISNTIE